MSKIKYYIVLGLLVLAAGSGLYARSPKQLSPEQLFDSRSPKSRLILPKTTQANGNASPESALVARYQIRGPVKKPDSANLNENLNLTREEKNTPKELSSDAVRLEAIEILKSHGLNPEMVDEVDAEELNELVKNYKDQQQATAKENAANLAARNSGQHENPYQRLMENPPDFLMLSPEEQAAIKEESLSQYLKHTHSFTSNRNNSDRTENLTQENSDELTNPPPENSTGDSTAEPNTKADATNNPYQKLLESGVVYSEEERKASAEAYLAHTRQP